MERLKSRLVQIYYDNLLKVRFSKYFFLPIPPVNTLHVTVNFHLQLTKPVEGLREWLEALYTAGTPCAVVSCLDRRSMIEALERMDLRKYFQVMWHFGQRLASHRVRLKLRFDVQAVVSEEDGMESIAHRFLSAAVKVLYTIYSGFPFQPLTVRVDR